MDVRILILIKYIICNLRFVIKIQIKFILFDISRLSNMYKFILMRRTIFSLSIAMKYILVKYILMVKIVEQWFAMVNVKLFWLQHEQLVEAELYPGSNQWYAAALPPRGSRFHQEFQVPPRHSVETLGAPQNDRRTLVEKPAIYFRDSTSQPKLRRRQFKREFPTNFVTPRACHL